MIIDSTERTDPIPVTGGPLFLNINGPSFGGTSVQVDWREEEGDEWTPLLNQDDEPLAVTEAYNKIITLGAGELSFIATGGTGIDLKVTAKRAY